MSITIATTFAVFSAGLLIAGKVAAATPGAVASPPNAPLVIGRFVGAPESVFDTANACELIDIPDAPARAFRDYRNTVHLLASHFVARAMLGANLDTVKRNCRVIYRSPQDPNPADFQDNNWLYSFYTADGREIAALVHSEFDAWQIPTLCATPDEHNNCWWNTITFAESRDGGQSFVVPQPPRNLVASLPYRYVVGNTTGAHGYTQPTNIVKHDGFYYALINAWPTETQRYGPCLIRTHDVFDPSSWRAWDGRDFTIRFADPYREPNVKAGNHVCQPVYAGSAESLVEQIESRTYICTQFTPDERFGPAGLYLMASRDLKHWSKPYLVATTNDFVAAEVAGKWTFGYSSLLDPSSTDRSFSTVSSRAYIYYVRFDQNHAPYGRALIRRQIAIEVGE